jgi:ketosteroid isomerase-like protein
MGTEVEDFLAATMPRLNQAEIALHNGDAAPRIAMWSRNDPVTVFGAARNGRGWAEIGPLFERLGSSFSNCTSYRIEVVAAGASGDLAYIVAFEHTTASIEHTTASIKGAPPQPYVLRVTTLFRREDGEWKVVHRHADPASETAGALAERMASTLVR